MSRMISTVMLFIVTLVVGILFYRVMIGFFVPLFLAALLVVIFRPMHEWIRERFGGRPRAAALTTTLAILVVVLLPAGAVVTIAAVQGTTLVSRVNYNNLSFALQRTRTRLGLAIENPEPFERLPNLVAALGDVDNLSDAMQRRQVNDRVREMQSVIRILEADFEPLDSLQEASVEQVRETIDEVRELLQEAAAQGRTQASVQGNSNAQGNSDTDGPSLTPAGDEASGGDEARLEDGDGEGAEQGTVGEVADSGVGDGSPGDVAVESEDAAGAEDAAESVDFRAPEERYQMALARLNQAVQRMNDALLGGSVRGQLKLWANPSQETIDRAFHQVREFVQPQLLSFTSATGEFVGSVIIGAAILVISLYFFLVDGPAMVHTLMRLSPLDDRYELKLLTEFERTSRAVVLATVLSALAQGILATIGYYFAGLSSIVLLFLLTSFLALIPFLGAASIWFPAAVWLGVVDERWGAALGLALYGAVIVSSVDNLIKVFVLQGGSQLHPLLALLSVLGGVQVFGPIGILVGPMVVVFLQTTLEILNHELSDFVPNGEESGSGVLAIAGLRGRAPRASGDGKRATDPSASSETSETADDTATVGGDEEASPGTDDSRSDTNG